MTNVYFWKNNDLKVENAAFVLGAFESIHNGHKLLLDKAKEISNDNVVVALFENPNNLPKNTSELFEELEIRIRVLANYGIKNILVLKYDNDLKLMEGEEFIEKLISMGAKYFVVGQDYKFGKGASWNAQKLLDFFPNTEIIALEKINETKISTSILKENVGFGEIEFVNHFLIEPYKILLNLNYENNFVENSQLIRMARGIYVAHFIYNEKKYHGYAHFDLNNNNKFYSLDSDWKDLKDEAMKKGVLEILKEIRIIVSENMNKIFEQDIKKALEFFEKK